MTLRADGRPVESVRVGVSVRSGDWLGTVIALVEPSQAYVRWVEGSVTLVERKDLVVV